MSETDIRELRAEIAVRLLGWRLVHRAGINSLVMHSRAQIEDDEALGYPTVEWSEHETHPSWSSRTSDWDWRIHDYMERTQNPMGWVGVVIDAMKARGYRVSFNDFPWYRVDENKECHTDEGYNVEFRAINRTRHRAQSLPNGEVQSCPDPERAVLTAALTALRAEDPR